MCKRSLVLLRRLDQKGQAEFPWVVSDIVSLLQATIDSIEILNIIVHDVQDQVL